MTEPSLEIPAPSTADTMAAPTAAAAAPATTTGTLVLEAPAPVAPVQTTQAAGAVPISAEDQAKLDAMVASYLEAVSDLDLHSPAFTDKVRDISKLGDDDIR